MATLYVFPKQVRKPKSGSTAVVHSKRKAKRPAAKKMSNLHSKSAFSYTIDPTNEKTTTTYLKGKATGIKKSTSFHSKPAKQTNKPKKRKKGYTSAERRAYWVGVGYQAGSDGYGFGMRPDRVSGVMTAKQQESFRNGRVTAADLTYEFIPDLVAGQAAHQHKRKRKK